VVGNGFPPFLIGKYIPFTVRGDPDNPNGAFFYPSDRPCVSITDGAGLKLEGITCDTSRTTMDCIDVFNGSYLDLSYAWFGQAGNHGQFLHMGVAWNSTVIFTGQIWITGSAASFMQIAHSISQANIDGDAPRVPVTFIGSPTFLWGVFLVDDSIVYTNGMSFSGSVIGSKATVMRNGVLFTNTGNGTARSCFTNPGTQSVIPGTWDPAVSILDNSVCQ